MYSAYFNALFVRWAKDDKTVKLEYEGPEDLAAVRACIKVMYLQKLDAEDLPSEPEGSISLLLKMICWADMLQAPTCTELCISKLADNFRPGSAKDVNGMLEGLPESVLELPSFAKVQEACQKWLQRSFADVHEVITKEELLEAFQQLCPRAVLTWMKHDDLIGTENDVAFLVTCWYEGEQGRAAQEQDLIALSRHLRVSQLATSVRECMLPVLPWFTEDHLLPIFTTIHRRYGSAAAQKFPHLSIPNSWVAARKTAVPGLARGEFEEREWFLWRVPLSAVAEMLEQQDAKSEYCSDWFYSKGAYFRANLVLKKPQMELRAEVSAKLVKNVPALDVQLLIRQSRPDVRGRGLKILDKSSVLSPKRRTCAVVAPPTTELMPVLQRQLVDGHLVFKIKVHPI
uniref:BACK domain-containing protein n=2 Tax=Dunaliella tertiolecta TaxID=3047 RepID=A0A7S3VUL2_DUNTE